MNKNRTSEFSHMLPTLLIGLVLISNVEAGLEFFFSPERFAGSFELTELSGEIAVAGSGLLFIMWNVPYVFAAVNPYKFKISLIESTIMQAIGLLGESILLIRIVPTEHLLLRSSILRFIIFDAAGFAFLLLALILVGKKRKTD